MVVQLDLDLFDVLAHQVATHGNAEGDVFVESVCELVGLLHQLVFLIRILLVQLLLLYFTCL